MHYDKKSVSRRIREIQVVNHADMRFTISRIEADPWFVRMLHNAPLELWVRRDSELGVPRKFNKGMGE